MQKILDYISENGSITDEQTETLLSLKKTSIYMITKKMRECGLIDAVGKGKNKKYILVENRK